MTGFYATIARYYDSEHHDKDDDFGLLEDLADQAGSPILIIGSGTGRLALHLAQAGATVHGIEIEPAMLERAEAKLSANPALHSRVTFYAGDARTANLPGKFKLILIPYNTFMHFHDQEEQIALLRRLRRSAAPDATLVIDLPNAGEAFASMDTGAVTLERTFLEQETGHLVMQQSVSVLDRAAQLMEVTWLYDEIDTEGAVKRTVVPVVNRYFFEPELRLLLRLAGFAVDEVLGDYDGSPFEDGSPRMIMIARLEADEA